MITLNQTPYQNLPSALEAARALPPSAPRVIEIRDQTLCLSQPITLTAEDNGLQITGNATLFGGVRLTEFSPDGDGFFSADVPEGADPAALVVNGRFCPRSCFPAEGTLTYTTTCDLKWLSSTNGGWNIAPTHDQLTRLRMDPSQIPADFVPENAYITVFHEWDESTVRVETFDRTTGEMTLRSEMEHPAGAFGKSAFVLRGIREGMTTPGQWYFDRPRRKVVYFPLPDEALEESQVFLPTVEQIFHLQNASAITISGLTLTVCNNNHQRSGLRAIRASGAIQAENCEDLTLKHLTITSVAGHGIRMQGCPDSKIIACRMENCGAGGIFQMECAPALIRGNTVTSIGRSTASAIGIHAGGKSQLVYVLDNFQDAVGAVEIVENTITDTPYCAITCNGGGHTIDRNRIRRCMTVLHDGAAIYASRAKNTRICGNVIAEVGYGQRKAHGIYFDEKSYGGLIAHNRIENVTSPMMFHMSHDIRIEHNVAVNTKGGLMLRPAASHHLHLSENIFAAAGPMDFILHTSKTDFSWEFSEIFCCRSNVVYSATGEYRYSYNESWNPPTEFDPLPPDNGILRLDPKLTLQDGEITLAEDSPLHWLTIL